MKLRGSVTILGSKTYEKTLKGMLNTCLESIHKTRISQTVNVQSLVMQLLEEGIWAA